MRLRPAPREGDRRFDGRGRRGEQGSALVELAVVLPILLMLVFGMVEFGIAFNDNIALRQGVREAARQGAVGNMGPTFTTGAPCHLTGASTASANVKSLMCLAKSRIGLDGNDVRVKVLSVKADFTSIGTFAKADSIIVCAQYPLESITSMFSVFFGGAQLRSKTTMRIELSDLVATGGEETAPTGGDWSWCTVSSESP
ncbi:MAG: pilus assembly protein [Acidimicrobiia bacterium]|nr:pilus assembly protein [Acidimicrobiia bacterium]